MQSLTIKTVPPSRPFSLSERDWEICEKAITFFFIPGQKLTANYLSYLIYECRAIYTFEELPLAIRIHGRLSNE